MLPSIAEPQAITKSPDPRAATSKLVLPYCLPCGPRTEELRHHGRPAQTEGGG